MSIFAQRSYVLCRLRHRSYWMHVLAKQMLRVVDTLGDRRQDTSGLGADRRLPPLCLRSVGMETSSIRFSRVKHGARRRNRKALQIFDSFYFDLQQMIKFRLPIGKYDVKK